MSEHTKQPKQSAPTPTPKTSSPLPEETFSSPRSQHDVLQLQRTIGNFQTRRLLNGTLARAVPDTTQPAGNPPVEMIQRRLQGTASALTYITPGSGTVIKDTWKKLVESVKDYEQLEQEQPTGGNLKKIGSGFEKLFAKLQDIRKLANQWIAENQAATTQERTAFAEKNYQKIIDNAATEKSNKITEARNAERVQAEQPPLPLDPLVAVDSEGMKSRQMGAVKSLLLRVTIEQQQVESGLRNPGQNLWFSQSEVYSDSTLPDNAKVDNAVGGAMNKLDRGQWTQPFTGRQTEGFFIKDKSIDPLIRGTGAAPIGIPTEDPNYAGRSLAMARIDQLISDKVIDMSTHVNPANSRMLVNMQLATHRRETARGSGQFETKMGLMSEKAQGEEFRSGFVESGNAAVNTQAKAAMGPGGQGKLALDDPALQRGLNKLQLLDAICGQVDRHLGNIYVKTNAVTGAVESVTGIDNDMAFGAQHTNLRDPAMNARLGQYAWRGLPPIADYEVAMAIRNIGENDLRKALDGLIAPAEIDATISRFRQIKEFLTGLPNEALIRHDQWMQRKDELAARQTGTNSYLGSARNETVQQWFKQNNDTIVAATSTAVTTTAGLPVGSDIPNRAANMIVGHLKNMVADGRIQLAQVQATGTTIGQAVGRDVGDRNDLLHNEIRDIVTAKVQAHNAA